MDRRMKFIIVSASSVLLFCLFAPVVSAAWTPWTTPHWAPSQGPLRGNGITRWESSTFLWQVAAQSYSDVIADSLGAGVKGYDRCGNNSFTMRMANTDATYNTTYTYVSAGPGYYFDCSPYGGGHVYLNYHEHLLVQDAGVTFFTAGDAYY
ncbi:MAG: hypothetical protein IMW89_05750 [Ktedonobacteraceae bacterium]|nr:hypothetical protein [Ktedonobacteraceae bacterium]